ncbi:MAG: TonB-dependent receptor [Bacteroidales bacterium]|nr:TonB-dependent receptor [Bacteroidales bacterium]
MKRLCVFLATVVFVGINFLQAQTVQITGTVTSAEDGMSVPGASVLVKGTSIGVATDIDGKYSISVPQTATTLVFSFIGMIPQEVEIAGRTVIDVVLQMDATELEEVIVVAYGTTTRSSFTGSAGTVKAEELQKRQVSNISNALSGQVAGVQTTSSSGQPGTSATVRIRGFGSMNASNTPLYVVDGVPYDGNISSINPQDIETMTVLKDAAANALYGARGANGVILITTKRAKGKEAVVTFDSKWGNNARAVPNYNVMTDPAMYYEYFYQGLYNSQAYNGKPASEAYAYADDQLLDLLGYQVYTIPDGERFIGTNFKLNPNATLGYSDGDYYYTPDDWFKEIFDAQNLRQEYNVSVSGTSDRFNYYFSAGFLDDSGIVSGSGFSRYTGRSNIDYQAKDWLRVGANIGYSNYNIQSPTAQEDWGSSGNLFYVTNHISPIYPIYVRNPDGSIKIDNMGLTVYDFGTTASTNNKRGFMALANPAITLKLNKYNSLHDELNSKWYAIITPVEGLTLTANIGANAFNRRQNNLSNPFYGSAATSQGYAYVAHYRQFSVSQQYFANYNKTFGDVHNIDIFAGYEGYERKMQSLSGSNYMLYNPWVGELNNAFRLPSNPPSSYTHRYAVEGFLSRLQYDYDDKYFFGASYRRDASSRFHPDNRWGNFGSLSLAWLMNKEDFMSGIDWIDMLKVKASVGSVGNDNLGTSSYYYYAYLDQFAVENSDGEFAVSFAYKGNPDITWETSISMNTGIDFSLFNSRLNGTVEYFYRSTADQLYHLPVPNVLGYSSMPVNVGDVMNSGVEVDFNGIIFQNDKITWQANINATTIKNEITSLHESIAEDGVKYSNSILEIGGSLSEIYMREYAGVDPQTGKALYYVDPDEGDYTTTDVWADANQAHLGSGLAKVYGGFGTSLSAYGFDLSVQLAYQLGGQVYDGSYEALMHSGDNIGHNWHMDIVNHWTPENTNTDVPRLNYFDDTYQKTSSRFVVSSDYLSLNSVVIGYTLPSKLLKSVGIASLRVYAAGDNLALLSVRKGFDPRQYFGGGGSTTSGSFAYSALKTFSGGVTLTF